MTRNYDVYFFTANSLLKVSKMQNQMIKAMLTQYRKGGHNFGILYKGINHAIHFHRLQMTLSEVRNVNQNFTGLG